MLHVSAVDTRFTNRNVLYCFRPVPYATVRYTVYGADGRGYCERPCETVHVCYQPAGTVRMLAYFVVSRVFACMIDSL
eukprot:SAG31_NODE_26564_length_440_cov_0.777126_1_plen_77_part_01